MKQCEEPQNFRVAKKSKRWPSYVVFGGCMWCIEKCMKFINKNAYIQTAIFGYHFCKAAKCAFFLILRNIARIMALSIVLGVCTTTGQARHHAGATFLCYVCLAYAPVAQAELHLAAFGVHGDHRVLRRRHVQRGLGHGHVHHPPVLLRRRGDLARATRTRCTPSRPQGDGRNSNKGKFAKKSKVAAAPAEDEGDAVI